MKESLKKSCSDYFSGTLNNVKASEINNYLKFEEGAEEEFRQAEKDWEENAVPTISQISLFSEICEKIETRKRARATYWSIASSAVAVAAALILALVLPARRADVPVTVLPQNVICSIETGFGEKTKVVLPDSTQIWLNSASKITYDETTFLSDRRVTLEGEACFDVTHCDGAQFVVDVAGNSITVLGTKFDVAAYGNEPYIEAALLEGSIEFTSSNAVVELHPGEKLSYNLDRDDLLKVKCDVSKSISWMENKLEYSSITLDRLLERISSISGAQISYTPAKLTHHPFSIMLNTRESVSNILNAVAFVLPITWSYDELSSTYSVKEK